MKRITSLISLVPAVIAPAIATPVISCSTKESGYLVQFVDGETVISSMRVEPNTIIAKPADPVSKTGQIFIGWYEDPDGRLIHNFDRPVTSDLILYTKWVNADQVRYFIENKTDEFLGEAGKEYYVVGGVYKTAEKLTINFDPTYKPSGAEPLPPVYENGYQLYINNEPCAYSTPFVAKQSVVSFKPVKGATEGQEIIFKFKSTRSFHCKLWLI